MTDPAVFEPATRCPHGNPYRWVVVIRESDRLLAEAFDQATVPVVAHGRADPECCAEQPPETVIGIRYTMGLGNPDTQ